VFNRTKPTLQGCNSFHVSLNSIPLLFIDKLVHFLLNVCMRLLDLSCQLRLCASLDLVDSVDEVLAGSRQRTLQICASHVCLQRVSSGLLLHAVHRVDTLG